MAQQPEPFNWAIYEGRLYTAPRTMTHAEWFDEIGIPSYGPEFDTILRGRVEIQPAPESAIVFSSQYPPEQAVEWFVRQFPQYRATFGTYFLAPDIEDERETQRYKERKTAH